MIFPQTFVLRQRSFGLMFGAPAGDKTINPDSRTAEAILTGTRAPEVKVQNRPTASLSQINPAGRP